MRASFLPNNAFIKHLCDSVYCRFKNKIIPIRSAGGVVKVNSLLASFLPSIIDEVRKIIMSSPNKSCDLYRLLPTTLLKACLHTLLYPITNIL